MFSLPLFTEQSVTSKEGIYWSCCFAQLCLNIPISGLLLIIFSVVSTFCNFKPCY